VDERTITLILTAPDSGETKITCDSVRFTVPDGERNRNTGGSVGIRPGHTDALMAVAPCTVRAFLKGRPVFSCAVGPGLAMIAPDTVSILTGNCGLPDEEKA